MSKYHLVAKPRDGSRAVAMEEPLRWRGFAIRAQSTSTFNAMNFAAPAAARLKASMNRMHIFVLGIEE